MTGLGRGAKCERSEEGAIRWSGYHEHRPVRRLGSTIVQKQGEPALALGHRGEKSVWCNGKEPIAEQQWFVKKKENWGASCGRQP